MGVNKVEQEKMRYVIFTEPLDERQFYNEYFNRDSVRDWKCEPDDYEALFKDDSKYKELSKKYKEARNSLEKYKDIKRQLINNN